MEKKFQDFAQNFNQGLTNQNLTDEQLLVDLANGKELALDALFLRHSGKILAYALKRGLPQERAEDLVQIVFLQLFRKKHLYKSQHKALAWIYVITRSELKDYKNREIKHHEEYQDSASAVSQNAGFAPRTETKDEAAHLLASLSPREKEVLELRFLSELEYQEIAERLGLTPVSIRQIVSRALRGLRKSYERR